MTANRVLTALAVLAIFSALLCVGPAGSQSPALPADAQTSTGRITLANIDDALASGPAFVEVETKECGYCRQQRPISEELAGEYAGKVTFFFVDAAEDRDVAKAFQVSGVPQINVIASGSGGRYTYVGKDGSISDSVASSKFLGLTQKDALKTALDAAVRVRGQ